MKRKGRVLWVLSDRVGETRPHPGLGLSRCVRCLRKGQLHEAVDSTVGRHGVASVVVDYVVTPESVNALLS